MIIPVILCGGAGSRLWPVSRETHPKPFMRLADGQSLLQKAFVRAQSLADVACVLTVTNQELFFKTKDDYQEVATPSLETAYLLEPFGRNTAAAVVMAALWAQKNHGDDAQLLVLPADHLIEDNAAFTMAVEKARLLADDGAIATFGIQPDGPETGFGYIEAEGTQVKRFVEKPDLATAQSYVASGRFFWNAGMFCFSVKTLLAEIEQHAPAILQACVACFSVSAELKGLQTSQIHLDAAAFSKVPSDSIDYALMEKTDKAAMVACNMGWSDVGSWSAVGTLSEPDAQGNRVVGKALLHQASNCFIQSDERMVAAVGVSDLIVVDTPDAVLVAHKDSSQDVKHIYNRLKQAGHQAHKLHRTVHRPWGTYTVLEEGDQFKIKRIEVKPGQQLSLQMHHHRSEHWVVVSGTAWVTNGEQELMLRSNESTYIPAGNKHRLRNPGLIDLVMIEVQSGQYLGEDDIVRFSDQYGRA